MVADRLAARAEEIDVKLTLIDKEVGYELRCADPIPFDAEYTRDLGYGAVKFLRSDKAAEYGAVISMVGGHLHPIPFADMINPRTGRMLPRRVDVKGEAYECARQYMIRLDRRDFVDPGRLAALSRAAGMTEVAFRERFGYVVKLSELDYSR